MATDPNTLRRTRGGVLSALAGFLSARRRGRTRGPRTSPPAPLLRLSADLRRQGGELIRAADLLEGLTVDRRKLAAFIGPEALADLPAARPAENVRESG